MMKGNEERKKRTKGKDSFTRQCIKQPQRWGLIVTEISKPVVCWVGWEVAAAAV